MICCCGEAQDALVTLFYSTTLRQKQSQLVNKRSNFCSVFLFQFFCLIFLVANLSQQIEAKQGETFLNTACRSSGQLLSTKTAKQSSSTAYFDYELLAQYPHDPNAFTEGLVFFQGHLFESTGLLGESSIRKLEIETGKVINNKLLEGYFFAEGLTLFQGKLVQLTWKRNQGFIYKPNNLQLIKTFHYPRDAWGITTIDNQLVISDGTSQLVFFDPENKQITKTIKVQDQGVVIKGLNELEFAGDSIFANVWQTPCIVNINPNSGKVNGWLDLSSLIPIQPFDWRTVMNGIAYDAERKIFYITGKHWPYIYKLKIHATKH